MSNNLNRTEVAAAQGSNVFVAINNADGVHDAAMTEALTVSIDSVTETLTDAQLRGNVFFILAAGSPTPGGAVTLTIGAIERGFFAIRNNCGETVTVTISGQPETPPTVATGAHKIFLSDGTNVYGF